jgi:hypothetical protein
MLLELRMRGLQLSDAGADGMATRRAIIGALLIFLLGAGAFAAPPQQFALVDLIQFQQGTLQRGQSLDWKGDHVGAYRRKISFGLLLPRAEFLNSGIWIHDLICRPTDSRPYACQIEMRMREFESRPLTCSVFPEANFDGLPPMIECPREIRWVPGEGIDRADALKRLGTHH